tara:strand:- start:1448 stop:2089 length:642 start_codon:yes stop_codon:yes gene_type:complete
MLENIKPLVEYIHNVLSNHQKDRLIIGVAGPPGAGKSTISELLLKTLQESKATKDSVLIPMDGFHFDNMILNQRKLLSKKGAPETFDVNGYIKLLGRIHNELDDIYSPYFDRNLDLAKAGAICINKKHKIIITEGNYLLLKAEPWCNVKKYLDITVFIDADLEVLEKRLKARWLNLGLSKEEATQKAELNDLPNARFVLKNSNNADFVIQNND